MRRKIAAKVRELRLSRRWTQAELSKQLHLSQNRLSEIERGTGSFTAEQFLLLLKLFNLPVNEFVREPGERDLRIQNALARLGAFHLQESASVLPSDQLDDVHEVVKEALVERSPRSLAALAPVLVRNAAHLNLAKLYVELEKLGMERRLLWTIENTLTALDLLRTGSGPKFREWARMDRMAEVVMQHFLDAITSRGRSSDPQPVPPDILDATIRSERTLREVQRSASKISQRWGIVTSLQVEDFLQALKAARASR